MDVTGIKRAEDLHFEMPKFLADDINNLVDAMANDDFNLDCYMDEVEGSARAVADEYDDWIRHYYLEGGWRKDVKPTN